VRKRLSERLLEEGARAVSRAARTLLADPRGQEALARAVGLAQHGLQLLESAQERALHAVGLAARPDYQELRKQVARLKRKARELSEKLDAAAGAAEPANDADAEEPDDGRPAH
jgi:hypothetical protein